MSISKSAFVCGPLTGLPEEKQSSIKLFYEKIGDVCEKAIGVKSFVPHKHYDPIKHKDYTPEQVNKAERRQVCKKTLVLVVVTVAPSWGGGIEVEMANRSDVPVILICEKERLKKRKISRLLRGNPAVKATITYENQKEVYPRLETELKKIIE